MKRSCRALLVNPWIYDFAAYNLWSEPTGLLEIGAYLLGLGYEVSLLDCLDRRHPDLRAYRIREDRFGCGHFLKTVVPKPDCVGHVPRRFGRYGLPLDTVRRELAATPPPDIILVTSGMTYWYPGVHFAIALLRQSFPDVPVVLGGIYATLCADHARRNSGADYVLPGDWKATLPALLHGLDLRPSDAPMPRYPAHHLRRNQGFAAVTTSRGCPYRCTYCASRLLNPAGYVPRPVDDVVGEIAYIVQDLQIPDIAFYDDALLVHSAEHLERILDGVMARGIRCRFHTPNGIHARGMTEALAHTMKQAGFETIRIGLETVSEATLQATGAKTSADEFARAVGCLKRAGFTGRQVGAYILAGLVGQTFREVMDTVAFVHSLGVTAHVSRFAPIQGTVEWERWVRAGLIAPDADPLLQNHVLPFPPGAPLTEAEYQAAVLAAREGNARLRAHSDVSK
jgi:radical SAM superfamily enzyme YgiQ (UPF0313 family)